MIGELKLIEAIEPLIILLQTTNSPKIRNATALALADLGDQKALPFLIAVISDPKTENYRGTLVYALQYFDCSKNLSFLVDLVINGNLEVSHEALQAIKTIDAEIDNNEFKECLNKLDRAIILCESEEKKELLEDLKDIFVENSSDS